MLWYIQGLKHCRYQKRMRQTGQSGHNGYLLMHCSSLRISFFINGRLALGTENLRILKYEVTITRRIKNPSPQILSAYASFVFALGFWVDFRKSRFWVWVCWVAMLLRSMAETEDLESHQLSHYIASLLTVFT